MSNSVVKCLMNFFCIIVLFCLVSCKSTRVITKSIDTIHKQEQWGVTLYERGDYESAFYELSELASWGYKDSQYVISLMFLKGQYVEQSTLIGMGWLKVASESTKKEWVELYQDLYNQYSIGDKKKFDLIAENYISKFGVKAQNVSCRRTTNGVSKRVITKCTKSDRRAKIYSIDLKESELELVGLQ